MGKAHNIETNVLDPMVSKKRTKNIEILNNSKGKASKRVCESQASGDIFLYDKAVVTALQHS